MSTSKPWWMAIKGVAPPPQIIEADPPANWQGLQNMVARILTEAGLDVEVEKKLELARGQANVDVSVRDRQREPAVSFVIECKRWKKSVPQSVVHTLRSIVADRGANGGFIVATGGFQSGAYQAAEKTSITLLTWEEFQHLFAERWYQNYAVPLLHSAIDPLMEYTEPINTRIFRKADALPEEKRRQFEHLRERHFALGQGFGLSYVRLPGCPGAISPALPLGLDFGEDVDKPRLPDDLLEASALRSFVDLLAHHARAAVHEFDEVFGERA